MGTDKQKGTSLEIRYKASSNISITRLAVITGSGPVIIDWARSTTKMDNGVAVMSCQEMHINRKEPLSKDMLEHAELKGALWFGYNGSAGQVAYAGDLEILSVAYFDGESRVELKGMPWKKESGMPGM